MKILLVDDTVEIREHLASKIKTYGDVTQATSGNEAARILETEKFDLIISDFNMPDGKGDVVLEAKNRLAPQTRFVFYSSEVGLQVSPGVLAVYDKFETLKLVSFVLALAMTLEKP